MICETCKAEGAKSSITEGQSAVTNMGISVYFDEEGVRHVHDPNNIITSYYCSRGHSWTERKHSSCPCGWPATPAPV
jgi:hypothetical protein